MSPVFSTLTALLLPALALAADAPWDEPETPEYPEPGEQVPEELPEAQAPTMLAGDPLSSPQTHDWSRGNALAGYRIRQIDHGSGVSVAQEFVVGEDGGTFATHFGARARFERVLLQVSLPVAAHRTPVGRRVGLGNLRLGVAYALSRGKLAHTLGVEGTLAAPSSSYTWVNEAHALWPSSGASAVWQLHYRATASLSLIGRVSAGAYLPHSYAPYPSLALNAAGSLGIDYGLLHNRLGIAAETSVSYWDTSPWEVAALARLDVSEGWRLRGGAVLPIAVWADWDPSSSLPGPAEVTLFADTSIAF